MNDLDVVIPHMYTATGANEALIKCITSYTISCPCNIIIINNDGDGYGKAVNRGLARTKSKFILVSNNDIILSQGSLMELAWEEGIIVPEIRPIPRDIMPRSIFCMPRWVYDTVRDCKQFYDERFSEGGGGYWEDDDLINRLRIWKIPIRVKRGVVVEHYNGGGLTMKQIGEQKWFDINKKRYEEKWNA